MKNEAASRFNSRVTNLVAKRDEVEQSLWSAIEQQSQLLRSNKEALELVRKLLAGQKQLIAVLDVCIAELQRQEQLPRCPACGQPAEH